MLTKLFPQCGVNSGCGFHLHDLYSVCVDVKRHARRRVTESFSPA